MLSLASVLATASPAQSEEVPPAWAYPVNPPDFKPTPDDGTLRRVSDSTAAFTLTQLRDLFFAPDWHPGDAVGKDAAQFTVEIGLARAERRHRLGDRRVFVRLVEPGAREQLHRAAVSRMAPILRLPPASRFHSAAAAEYA